MTPELGNNAAPEGPKDAVERNRTVSNGVVGEENQVHYSKNDAKDSQAPEGPRPAEMPWEEAPSNEVNKEANATFISGSSEANDGNDMHNYCLRYLVIFAGTFVFIVAAILLPLIFLTDLFKGDGGGVALSSSSPSKPPSGGLPIPTPPPTPTLFPEPTLSPTLGLTQPPVLPAPTQSPSTIAQTVPESTLPPTGAAPVPTTTPTTMPTRTTVVPTASPTISPTVSPTVMPTVKPTLGPTNDPTRATTDVPTSSPTPRPTTATPTALFLLSTTLPTTVDLTNTPLFSYLVVLGVPANLLRDSSTPQGKTFLWLMQPNVEQISVFRVPERFVLVALDFALHGTNQALNSNSTLQGQQQSTNRNDPTSWSQPAADMCTWRGVTCDGYKQVTGVKWSNEGLTGTMIPEIKLLTNLKKVDLAENSISGSLDAFWELPQLTHLYLFKNRFSGSIPERAAPQLLEHVYLGFNQLTGTLPLSVARSSSLKYLILHNNSLSGSISEDIRLRQLFYLDLSNNNFVGSLPSTFASMLPQLRIIYLSGNQFSGNLPGDFNQLGNGRMKQLFINSNKFTGEFPGGWDDYTMSKSSVLFYGVCCQPSSMLFNYF